MKTKQQHDSKTGGDSRRCDAAPCSAYWPLFNHMSNEHGLILLESEMEDVLQIADQMLMRRLDASIARIGKNMRLIDTRLRLMTATLRQIANSGRNSTRDRRHAKATRT